MSGIVPSTVSLELILAQLGGAGVVGGGGVGRGRGRGRGLRQPSHTLFRVLWERFTPSNLRQKLVILSIPLETIELPISLGICS